MRVRVVASEITYWSEVKLLKGSSEFFEDQGDVHGEIDGELQEALEAILMPFTGPWEQSDIWFHNQDFYGDGVRSLTFRAGSFPWQTVGDLQKLLIGESAKFCISVQFADSLDVGGRWVGSLGILEHDIVATPYVVEMLKEHVNVET